ncbi:amino acid adenylation domain-containing protein, partial [Dyella flagellata]
SPDALAIIYGEERLSYAELNARANRLAHWLIRQGVQPDERVAICVERSTHMVVGLLGILKAGGAYVPVDPAYPEERRRYMLKDAAPRILLTDASSRRTWGGTLPDELTVLELDAEQPAWAAQAEHNPVAHGLTSSHLAYVIYTSGSTGLPKGVPNEHRALANRLQWMQDAYSLQAHDVVAQKTPFSFDVSVWEFFWTLQRGATLAVMAPGAHRDADQLARWIIEQGVTTIHFVPSMLGSFLEAHEARHCTTLTRVICSGEALPAAMVRRFAQILPTVALHNLYGPTEAAIDVTAWTCPYHFDDEQVPIGRPIANTQIYLLDPYQQPVPLGSPGEIHIGGAGVARGYLNRPELTDERFLPDPFSRKADARMYRTGDLAKYLPNGNILYLGRNDHQVKIRGFRIELGEIDARLGQHPGVREAVVVARDDHAGEKRLVAYVVSHGHAIADDLVATLRAHLSERLPDYMVPSAFVLLDALPLTPNGKLDRKALPAAGGEVYARQAYAAPQGAIEQTLAQLWQELLGVEHVGRQDNFFALGGHSLLAVRLLSRLRSVLRMDLPLSRFFATRTLADLADAIAEQLPIAKLAMPAIMRLSRERSLPPSFAQQRLWFLAQLEGVSATYHMPLTLRLHGTLDVQALRRSLDAIWSRHDSLRSTFLLAEGSPIVGLLQAESGMPWQEEELPDGAQPVSYVRQRASEEIHRAFDLEQGPLIRTRL